MNRSISQKAVGVIKWLIILPLIILVGYITCKSFTTVNGLGKRFSSIFDIQIIFALGVIVLISVFIMFSSLVKRLSERKLIILTSIMFAIILVVQIFFVVCLDCMPFTDLQVCADSAQDLVSSGKLNSLYYETYPNNRFFTIELFLFARLFNAMGVNFYSAIDIVTLLHIDLALVFMWLAVKRAVGLKRAACVLFICIFNPILYFGSEFCYTSSWCLPCTSIILFLSVSICMLIKERKENANRKNTVKLLVYSIMLGVVTAVGYVIRVTAIIPFIAFLCIIVIYIIHNVKVIKKVLYSIGACALALAISLVSLNAYTNSYCDFNSNENTFPSTHWIMMSFGETGRYSASDVELTQNAGNYDDKIKANLDELGKRIDDMGLSGMMSNFSKKLEGTWADGTHNLLVRISITRTENKLYNYFGGSKSDIAVFACQIFHISTLILILISCVSQLRKKRLDELSLITLLSLLGGIIFYLFWEISAIYSLPFMFVQIAAASDGLNEVSRKFELSTVKNPVALNKSLTLLFVMIFSVSALCFIEGFKPICKDESTWSNYSVNNNPAATGHQFVELGNGSADIGTLEQEFYSSTEFNMLYFACKSTGKSTDCQYRLDLMDDNGLTLFTAQFVESNIQNNMIKFNLPYIKANGREKYKIKITKLTQAEDSIEFGFTQYLATDNIDGKYTVNGVDKEYMDLFLNVGNQYTAPYFTSGKYMLICLVILMVEIILYIWSRIYIDLKNKCISCGFTKVFLQLKEISR